MKLTASGVFAALAGAVVLVAIVAGIVVVGSPHQARLRSLDQQRVQALQRLSNQVDAAFTSDGALPRTVQAIARQDAVLPWEVNDPETHAPYEYRVTGDKTYQLCAVFGATSDPDIEIRWRHGVGRTCFDFTAPAKAPGGYGVTVVQPH